MEEMSNASVQHREYCSECGNSIGRGSRFCMYCGGVAYSTLPEHAIHRTHLPVLGGLLIIAGAAFNFVSAWYVNEFYADFSRIASLSSAYHLTLVFVILLGILGIVSLLGGFAALSRGSYTLAIAGGIASCLSVGALVGLAGLLIVAVSRDEFAKGAGLWNSSFGAAPATMSASEQALTKKGG